EEQENSRKQAAGHGGGNGLGAIRKSDFCFVDCENAKGTTSFDLSGSEKIGKTGLVMDSREEQITQLRAAIAAQENLRPTLGDETVELSLKPLRGLLDSLVAEQALSGRREASPRDQALLTELQRYMPKQLADKIRASGHLEGERRQ